jgi:hypothetical protein
MRHGYLESRFLRRLGRRVAARSMIISANSEDEIVEEAESELRNAVRLELVPLDS